MDEMNKDVNAGTGSDEKKKGISFWIGLGGIVTVIISFFTPYLKDGNEWVSLFDIEKIFISASSHLGLSGDEATFVKLFIPISAALIILFTVIYLLKSIKLKPVGMIICTILVIVVYEIQKNALSADLSSGSVKKGAAFFVIYVVYALLIAGIVACIVEKVKKSNISD